MGCLGRGEMGWGKGGSVLGGWNVVGSRVGVGVMERGGWGVGGGVF